MTHHTASVRLYLGIFAALLSLTALTVATSYYDLGGGRLHILNALIALTIAITKALLVALFFMHVRWSGRLTWIFLGAGLFWLLILFTLTLSDYLTRPEYPPTPPAAAERTS
jgi:cytochrome c oxidase subunit 4